MPFHLAHCSIRNEETTGGVINVQSGRRIGLLGKLKLRKPYNDPVREIVECPKMRGFVQRSEKVPVYMLCEAEDGLLAMKN